MEYRNRNQHEERHQAVQPEKQGGQGHPPAGHHSHGVNQHGPSRAGSPYKGRPAQQGNGTRRTKREWKDML